MDMEKRSCLFQPAYLLKQQAPEVIGNKSKNKLWATSPSHQIPSQTCIVLQADNISSNEQSKYSSVLCKHECTQTNT